MSPTLFPEVFNKDGSINYPLALKLYASTERIDDIEVVRQDAQRRGLLGKDGKIMVYGGSGGGVLVQQYLDKYGEHVSRALIESSGGPDLAREHNCHLHEEYLRLKSMLAESYFVLSQERDEDDYDSLSLAFMLFKIGLEGNTELQNKTVNNKTDMFCYGC